MVQSGPSNLSDFMHAFYVHPKVVLAGQLVLAMKRKPNFFKDRKILISLLIIGIKPPNFLER